MITRQRKSRRFEQLESRYALAGNVTAAVDGSGNLLIKGDSLANGIIFTETSTGKFDLTGINAGGVATSINGQANGTVHLTGVTGSITIRMLDGDDNIQLPYFNYGGWMIINSGNGKDSISMGNNSNASFLVGVLSIRTQEGADTITENNINVIGNQDLGATQTDGGAASANGIKFTISDSTFGSFLYFNFGGRRTTLEMSDVIAAGEVITVNRVVQEITEFGQTYEKYIQVSNRLFRFTFLNSSAGGNLTMDSSLTTQFVANGSHVGEQGAFVTVGATNTFTIMDGSFGSLSIDTQRTYVVPNGVFSLPSTTHTVESTNDFITLNDIYVTGLLDLQSNQNIRLTRVTAETAILAATFNEHADISVAESYFTDLTISLGSVKTPNSVAPPSAESSPSQLTTASISSSQITGTLTYNSATRLKQAINRVGESNQLTSFINAAKATYYVYSSTINRVEYLKTDESAPYSNTTENIGDTTYFFKNSAITTVAFLLSKANDAVTFETSTVSSSTQLDGGAGTNYLFNNGSSLQNLSKSNFAN